MDDLIVSGAIGLVVFYAAVILIILGIGWFILEMIAAILAGNIFGFAILALGAAIAAAMYVCVGLWLKKTGTI
ncbi:MAG: hypothetical protein WC342_09650 [Methanoregula sp.]